jgi:hypothetical protein
MIDCSKTENYFAEKQRMTKRTKEGLCEISCSDCPLYNENNGTSEGLSCGCLEMHYPKKAISIVQRWSDEHPQRTYLSELLKIFPNTPLKDDGTPHLCPSDLGWNDSRKCREQSNCVKCWNLPIPIEEDEE